MSSAPVPQAAACRLPSLPGCPPSDLVAGQELHGFRIVRVTPLPAIRATAVEARHVRTGARLLHLLVEDTENLGAIAFRTPPTDDTGVPHILEHSVLCGSRRFPVKDPFLEMMKRSMATFINAFTYPDKTVYPVASNVRQDFLNLFDVYLDAVFFPNIGPDTLKQEGHHLEPADPDRPADSPLTIKGIVYNEMKGAYSELDAVIERASGQGLFPDSPYGRDSGGDPKAIPSLTYEQFRDFHRRCYHPANSYIMLYGGTPTAELLAFIHPRLDGLTPAIDPASAIPRQPRWTAPREHEEAYPVAQEDGTTAVSAVTVSWIVGAGDDPADDLALEVMDKLLLGHAGAPLHKALIDSRLGEDLAPSGYSGGTLEGAFHVGLKGTEPERRDAVVALILRTLESCAAEGFSRPSVEAAFQQLEYAHREITANYPLRLMNRVYDAWIYDQDPLTYLRLGEILGELRRRYAADPGLFARLVRTQLLENPHRLTCTFRPDAGLQARRDAEFAEAMARAKAELPAADLESLAAEAKALARRQGEPNAPADLAKLPALRLSDLPEKPLSVPAEVVDCGGVPFVRTGVFANGINYFVLAFDLSGLPDELWDYLPVFTDFWARLGAAGSGYAETGERIAACTGGLSSDLFATVDARDPDRVLPFLSVTFKSLDARHGDALAVVRDLLLAPDLADSARLRDLAFQLKAQRQSGIIDSGHRFAAQHALRGLSALGALNHRLGGIPQVRLAGELARTVERDAAPLREKLESISRFLLDRNRLRAAFTGSSEPETLTRQWLAEFAAACNAPPPAPSPAPSPAIVSSVLPSSIPTSSVPPSSIPTSSVLPSPVPASGSTSSVPPSSIPTSSVLPFSVLPSSAAEGLAIASEVAFCAAVLPAPPQTSPDAPALAVFSQILSLDYLWQEIRVKGGAYGGFCVYDPGMRAFELMSYRDPGIVRTLELFAGIRQALRTMPLEPADIERAIISCAKGEERPVRPGAATAMALWRYLTRADAPLRLERYQALLRVTAADVRRTASALFADPAMQLCVLGGRPLLEAAAAKLKTPLAIENILEPADEADADPTGAWASRPL